MVLNEEARELIEKTLTATKERNTFTGTEVKDMLLDLWILFEPVDEAATN